MTMAKETIIIFVYDSLKVQKEEDDPATAILYFHPTWVSDQQKAALCGQIIGTLECVKTILKKPNVVSLQSGKFFIMENGRYLLAVGTDRNITDWLLEYRAKTLYSLVKFFHKDFETLAKIYTSDGLSTKLYHIFDTYLKMLVFGGNIFSHIPSLALPKSASNVFIEAVHILECCQEHNHVLGGSIIYHNKVIATQLSSDLTKRLVLSDPYRIKCPAEVVEVLFDLPLGVQLLQVYVSDKEYCKLLESSMRNRSTFQYLSNKSIRKNYTRNIQQPQETPIISAMKRDQSLIFTAVPEEGSDHSTSLERSFIPAVKRTRPKFLNLKTISIDEHIEVKTFKQAPLTPFCGQTSVCSTPMTELKKFIHQNPLSICRNSAISEKNVSPVKTIGKSVPDISMNSILCAKKFTSMTDLSNVVNSISKKPAQYFSLKDKTFMELDLSTKKLANSRNLKTITDPTFPVFKLDGTTVISRTYYEDYLKRNLELVQTEVTVDTKDPFQNFDSHMKITEKLPNNVAKIDKLRSVPDKHYKEHKKSLTLPLKSLSTDSEMLSDTSMNRKYSMGVQLTPLMSKLSMLAFEERSSGFCSKETTPCDYRGLTPTHPNFSFPYGKCKANKEVRYKNEDGVALQKCVLFVCGQQDIVLSVLLREECCDEPSVIKKLWEICTEHLNKLEKQLSYCMETQTGANPHESEPYSYLCLDSEWDTIRRGGPWGTNDLTLLNYLHRDFNNVYNLTEILVRGGDNIIYGHHYGPTEVFYHELANSNAGLPPPADPMGLVQLKAKRRLERDHTVILL